MKSDLDLKISSSYQFMRQIYKNCEIRINIKVKVKGYGGFLDSLIQI